jgi:ribonuclease E
MPKRMLIDASHPEETRVVVLDGQKVEEFDFEAASKRPLKGNIYLAKVTRVEPSLQAAFVEYGGNRQGFLAFSEIHPDYYQIPVADRIALLAEAEAEARRRQEDDVESFEISSGPKPDSGETDDDADEAFAEAEGSRDEDEQSESGTMEAADDRHGGDDDSDSEEVFTNHPDRGEEPPPDEATTATTEEAQASDLSETSFDPSQLAAEEISQGIVDEQTAASAAQDQESHEPHGEISTEPVGESVPDMQMASQAPTEAEPARALQASKPPQRWMRRRHYKIQEVIKRRQIILVQVVKEERGNKGAALTTYLSLAGRYCVLMPNTPRGGGISRKITNAADRKRLKSAAQSLELPEGMGLIIRTAGENRTKLEIKRDYEYLLRLWDTIRELTLKSNAPACVYEEGDLIKRAIRDLYNKDVAEVVVEGDEGYRNAKDFMRMLMPSHAKNVRPYKEPVPLFQSHHIEAQLDAMFSPTVTLRSGGYIVINQTEALVSIDVNSGRATREHSIEETAHKTNLEAADEIGRQLRLRDLAGLIVIDFIDMEDARNDRDVERRLRDAVKNDRARVQIGRISQFGLLEMSRQRLRAGVIAGSTVPCPHCGGQGIVRSVESTALRVLRALEEEGQRLKASAIIVRVASDVAIYTLNQKRKELARVESDYGMEISFEPKEGLLAGTFDIERTSLKSAGEREKYAVSVEAGFAQGQGSEPADDEVVEAVEAEGDAEELAEADEPDEALESRGVSARPLEDSSRTPSVRADGGVRRRPRHARRCVAIGGRRESVTSSSIQCRRRERQRWYPRALGAGPAIDAGTTRRCRGSSSAQAPPTRTPGTRQWRTSGTASAGVSARGRTHWGRSRLLSVRRNR